VLRRATEPAAGAGLVRRVLTDDALRARVMETQARAIAEVRATDFGALLLDRLRPVLERPAPAPSAAAAGAGS
jgi:hypothetical protein